MAEGLPCCIREARQLFAALKLLSDADRKVLWRCSDQLFMCNTARLLKTDGSLTKHLTPALIAYEGIQYQYLSPKTLDRDALRYLEAHLRILSGLYGVLRPMDGVVPYRLEMQAKLRINDKADLYAFWGSRVYDALRSELGEGEGLILINLASQEYAKAVCPYVRAEDRLITCVFCEEKDGKRRQKATLAKMARGEMVRFLAERGAETPEALCEFDRLGFRFCPESSTGETYMFVKTA